MYMYIHIHIYVYIYIFMYIYMYMFTCASSCFTAHRFPIFSFKGHTDGVSDLKICSNTVLVSSRSRPLLPTLFFHSLFRFPSCSLSLSLSHAPPSVLFSVLLYFLPLLSLSLISTSAHPPLSCPLSFSLTRAQKLAGAGAALARSLSPSLSSLLFRFLSLLHSPSPGIHTYVHFHIHTYINAYTNTYINFHMHTYIHTYMNTKTQKNTSI